MRRCPSCGSELPPEASPEGLCPRCLLLLGPELPPQEPEEEPTLTAPPSEGSELGYIGPYRLVEALGEGGMGVVYLAEQQGPVRRRVALKLIKLGMDSKEVIARFESERQALALMSHPGIARVLDAGTSEEGRPYFVMEHVAGLPITDYCDRHQLSTAERLELFTEVCRAVHHAHQRGIIHRDLKPSNVLVTLEDGRPRPKVIDFGVAKAIHQRLTEKTLFTQRGVLVGTPEYMSPEQAEGSELDVDTTTDIYSLGVLLYELLTGTVPFEPERLRRAGYAEIQRILREEEPVRPSTRVSSLGETGAEIARRRHTDVVALARTLRGDLNWITLRALEKDRTRRYPSATELAGDVRRHLTHEPVTAGPPGAGYRLRKLVRKHRLEASFAAVLLLVLVAFAVVMTYQAHRIARERDRAELEARRANLEAEGFELEFMGTEDDESAQRGLEILRQALALHRQALGNDPELARHLIRFATLLDLARSGLFGPRPPEVEAEMVALLREALEIRRRLLPEGHPDILASIWQLLDFLDNNVEGAEPEIAELRREALQSQRRLLPEGHPDILANMRQLADSLEHVGDAKAEAEAKTLRQTILRHWNSSTPPGDPRVVSEFLWTLRDSAHQAVRQGECKEVERLVRDSIELLEKARRDHESLAFERAHGRSHVGECLMQAGRYEEAESALLESLKGYEELGEQGEDRRSAAHEWKKLRQTVVDLYEAWGKADKAQEYRLDFSSGLNDLELLERNSS